MDYSGLEDGISELADVGTFTEDTFANNVDVDAGAARMSETDVSF